MKILLLGDYSGLHVNLAQGLRILGQDVTIASGGDLWKNFERDIDLKQPEKFKRPRFLLKLIKAYPKLCGHDIVQLIGPNPLATSPFLNTFYLDLLRKHNNKIFLGANGMDYFYCKYALEGKLKYSIFQQPEIQNDTWVKKQRESIENQTINEHNIELANNADGITACAVGYYYAHQTVYPQKTTFIPLPINTDNFNFINTIKKDTQKINFFLGKMKNREVRKGTDIIENVLSELKKKYPNDVNIRIAESIPFKAYHKMMDESHILCDQLYAYGIGMNGLIAQSKGLIAAGGADSELYKLLDEKENKPIIDLNVPKKEMLATFEQIIEHKEDLEEKAYKSHDFVMKHHNYIKVAQQYLDFWKTKMI